MRSCEFHQLVGISPAISYRANRHVKGSACCLPYDTDIVVMRNEDQDFFCIAFAEFAHV
jgi:hypothetical protein